MTLFKEVRGKGKAVDWFNCK